MAGPCWNEHLDRALRRTQEAIARGRQQRARAAEQWLRGAGQLALDAEQASYERRQRRKAARRAQRHRERLEQASAPKGVVLGLEAIVLVVLALVYPGLWWLVFPSLWLAMSSAAHLSRVQERRRLEQGALPRAAAALPSFPEIDERLSRLDALCARLLEEIERGPRVLRDFVSRPGKTVKALRRTCHALADRERELRGAVAPEEEKRLLGERVELAERVARETDPIVRARFGAALAALEQQLRQRQELATAATRLEAEGTRILYMLENLFAQILRMKSADAGSPEVVGSGLRESLELLGQEVDAIADALQEANEQPAIPAPGAALRAEESASLPHHERVH